MDTLNARVEHEAKIHGFDFCDLTSTMDFASDCYRGGDPIHLTQKSVERICRVAAKWAEDAKKPQKSIVPKYLKERYHSKHTPFFIRIR